MATLGILATLVFALLVSPSSENRRQFSYIPNIPYDGWIYDHSSPWVNNVNQRGNIRCIGGRDPSIIPRQFTGQSILEFCATPTYGGRWATNMPEDSAGAFCAYHMSPPRLAISRPPGASMSRAGWTEEFKVWHYCQTKCKCTRRSASISDEQDLIFNNRQLARGTHHKYSIERTGESFFSPPWWLMSMYTTRSFTRPKTRINNVRHPIPITPAEVIQATSEPPVLVRKMMISGAIENAIYCEGELPPWIDRISHKYNTNLELCAANFLGGHPSANLGGLCRDPFRGGLAFGRQFAHPDLSRDVVGGPDNVRKSNFFSATLWCLAHCACNYQPNEGYERWPISVKRDGLGQININANGEVSLLRGTGVNVVVTVFVYRTSSSKDSPPRPKKRCVPSVLESSASDEWCFLPVPPDIDLSEFDLPAMAPEPVLQSCGSSCQSNFECGGGRDTDCKCVAKPPGLIDGANRRGGFSVSNLFAACAKVQFAGSGLLAGGSGLRKRNDLELEAPWCACNSTYVSEQCCGSQEGLVWERHELKRGELGTST